MLDGDSKDVGSKRTKAEMRLYKDTVEVRWRWVVMRSFRVLEPGAQNLETILRRRDPTHWWLKKDQATNTDWII